jgi:hypothetical protein
MLPNIEMLDVRHFPVWRRKKEFSNDVFSYEVA